MTGVQVVARPHPLRDEFISREFAEGLTIAEIAAALKVKRGCKVVAFVNGEPCEDQNEKVWSGDHVALKVLPGSFSPFGSSSNPPTGGSSPIGAFGGPPNTNSSTWAFGAPPQQQSGGGGKFGGISTTFGLLAGVGGLFLSMLGNDPDSFGDQSALWNPLAPPPDPRFVGGNIPATSPIKGVGGDKDAMMPILSGISNQTLKWGKVPKVYGTYRMYPPHAALPYTLISGNDQYLYCLFCLGVGEVEVSDLRIGDRPIDNFPTAEYEIRYGTAVDSAITLYTQDIEETPLTNALTYNNQVINRCGQVCDQISVDIQFDQGLFQYITVTNPDGSQYPQKSPAACGFNVEYRLATSSGAWTLAGSPLWTENHNQPIRRNFSVDVPRGLYDVRITRTQLDSTDANVITGSSWVTLRAILKEPPIKPQLDGNGNPVPIAYIALKIKATQENAGALQDFNCLVSSKLQTWNGAAWTAPVKTASPAWIFADLITGKVNNRPKSQGMLDTTVLLEWANWCAEKGFEFNLILDQEQTLHQCLKDVAAAGRAFYTMRGNKHTVVIDKERAVIAQWFGPRNIIKGSFKGKITTRRMPEAVKVKFINPDADWQPDTRIVPRDGFTETSAHKFEVIDMRGCTSKEAAYKHGRYFIAAALLRSEEYEWESDIEGIICTLGDRVRMTHDLPKWGLGTGRIKSLVTSGSDITGVVLDEPITMASGQTYTMRIRRSDNTTITRDLVTTPGEYSQVAFTSVISAGGAAVGDLVFFGLQNQDGVDLVITGIEHSENFRVRFKAVDYAPAVYTADTGAIPPFNPQITIPHEVQTVVPPPVIWAILSDENVLDRQSDGSLQSRIALTMKPPGINIRAFQYQKKRTDSNEWDPLESVDSVGTIYVTKVEDRVSYDLRVRNVTYESKFSEWTLTTPHTVIGKTSKPPMIQGLDTIGGVLQWNYPNPPLDFAGFRVKINYCASDNWAQATVLSNLQKHTQFDLSGLPPGVVTILIAAVDVANNESEPAVVVKDFGAVIPTNLYVEVDDAPTFSAGTIVNGTVDGGWLKADSNGSLFWTGSDEALYWTQIPSTLFWAETFKEMTYTRKWTPSNDLHGLSGKVYLDLDIDAENYKVEYRIPGASLFWDVSSGGELNPFWTGDSNAFWKGEQAWLPWPGELPLALQEYEIKVTVFASALRQGTIKRFGFRVDVPDIDENFAGLVIDSAGTRLPISKGQRAVKFVNATIFADATYPNVRTYEIIDQSVVSSSQGPLLKCFDSAHNPVAGKLNVTSKGY